ncbi:MAG: hypothetical protein PHU88_09435 [candidate division Zixibacteria bacterium]|nr:hypothetical protein [candidate division Zixibacteria bacterium]MDD5426234.1 hypothetical protein [candidate division Zixibacteria bacterium]
MYKIEKSAYGLKITLSEILSSEEALQYKAELIKAALEQKQTYSVIFYTQILIPFNPEVMKVLEEAYAAVINSTPNLCRVAVITKSPVVKDQTRRLQHYLQVSDIVRIIDVSKYADWEKKALDWVLSGVEPEVDEPTLVTTKK